MRYGTSSTSSSAERAAARLLAAALLWAAPAVAFADAGTRIAVFPPVNRTGRMVPVETIQASLESALAARGFALLPYEELESFFAKHRVRYTGGISAEVAQALGAETGVDGAVLTSVDDWDSADPPRVALTSRWVAAIVEAPVAWTETSAHHGQERPGAFGLGIVTEVDVLLERATADLARSLASVAAHPGTEPSAAPHLAPASLAVDPGWVSSVASDRPIRIAVLPFVADARPREIGETVAQQFVRHLLEEGFVEVLEPGVVRHALLEARVIQDGGPSLPEVDALRALLDVDLVVSGRVTDFEAIGGAPGTPFVGFSSRGIDTRSRQVVWSAFSFARGDDRPGPFEAKRIRSSSRLTSRLVRGVVRALAEEIRSERSRPRAAPEKEATR